MKILTILLVLVMLGSYAYAIAITEPVEYFEFEEKIEVSQTLGSDVIVGEDPEGIYKAEIVIGGI